MNSCTKGKVGEREWRDVVKKHGYDCRRGQQFSGSPDSPDVVSEDLSWIHFEVKRVEKLNVTDAMEQSIRDAGTAVPVVAHRKNGEEWLVTMRAEDFFAFVRHVHFFKQAGGEPK